MLWETDNFPNVDSRSTALRRLYQIEQRLDRDSEYAAMYYREMARLIYNGYAEKVNEDISRPRIWYLPHFGVANANKPRKLRLVFDAADLLQSLLGVILRFRQYAVAFKADIKEMFLRIFVNESDRGALRFF